MVSSYQAHIHVPVREEYPCVGAFMSKSFVHVPPDMDIYQVMGVVIRERVSGVLVVEAPHRLLGIVSEKDLLRLSREDTYSNQSTGGPASAFMTTDLITLTLDQGLNDVADLFVNYPFKKFPVLDGDKLVGVVRRRDVLMVIEEFYRKSMKFLRNA